MKKIAIIILNWKQASLSKKLIKQFATINTKGISYHIFLVDNHSPDKSYQQFLNLYKSSRLISLSQTAKNIGFAGGINFGIKQAIAKKYKYALIINNDVKLHKNFLKKLLTPFSKSKKLAITGPKIYFAKGYEYQKNRYQKNELGRVLWSVGGGIDWQNIYGFNIGIDEVDSGQYNKINSDIDFISGCCMLVDLIKIKKVGLFDENYFMYLEDADLCQRVKRAGYSIAYIPASVIWHYNAASSQAGGQLQQYFLSRNRLYFASKFSNLRTKFALLRQSIGNLVFGKYVWQKRGIVDFYLNRLNKASWQ